MIQASLVYEALILQTRVSPTCCLTMHSTDVSCIRWYSSAKMQEMFTVFLFTTEKANWFSTLLHTVLPFRVNFYKQISRGESKPKPKFIEFLVDSSYNQIFHLNTALWPLFYFICCQNTFGPRILYKLLKAITNTHSQTDTFKLSMKYEWR